MHRTKSLLLGLVLGLILVVSAPAAAQDIWMELAPPAPGTPGNPRLLGPSDDFPGHWEYAYDIYSYGESLTHWGLTGFDATQCPNLCGGSACQRWDPASAGFSCWGMTGGSYPSRGDEMNTWSIIPGECDWPMLNLWHEPWEYGGANCSCWFPGAVSDNGLDVWWNLVSGQNGLVLTLRVVHPLGPNGILEFWGNGYGIRYTNEVVGPGTPAVHALEVFYSSKYGDAVDPAKAFLAVGEASQISLIGDDLHGNVTNYCQGITGIRVSFTTLFTFSGGVAAAFSYDATPEQSADKTFSPFTPLTSPVYAVDDSAGYTVVTITFAAGEIKNRWLKTIIDASQVSANSVDLDGELPSPLSLPSGDGTPGGNAEFIIGNRLGDVDANYRCLLNDAIAIRNRVSGVLVGISNTFDIDKNERILLNEAIGARNAVSGIALPALP